MLPTRSVQSRDQSEGSTRVGTNELKDSFYSEFESRHRGSRELILDRLSAAYLPFVRPLSELQSPPQSVDLGCGRGEWLEIASAEGFDARGVDLDEGMLQSCFDRGLQAHRRDALEELRGLPDESVALVTAFHLVEHLPFPMVRELTSEAQRVLVPGGLLVYETPNPENVSVGATSFYMDPTHDRPLPSELLDFAVENAGFVRTKVVRLQEDPTVREGKDIRLLQVLQGVSADYAVVGQKSGPPEALALLDEAFATDYGVSLHAVASAYDKHVDEVAAQAAQADERAADAAGVANAAVDRADAAVDRGDAAVDRADAAVDRAETLGHDLGNQLAGVSEQLRRVEEQLTSLHTRNAEHAARAQAHQAMTQSALAQLSEVYASTSWRVSAPLRAASDGARRLRSARAEGRLWSGIRRRISRSPSEAQLPESSPPAAVSEDQLSARARRVREDLHRLTSAVAS
jgi:SAM-dependent methyltransferase